MKKEWIVYTVLFIWPIILSSIIYISLKNDQTPIQIIESDKDINNILSDDIELSAENDQSPNAITIDSANITKDKLLADGFEIVKEGDLNNDGKQDFLAILREPKIEVEQIEGAAKLFAVKEIRLYTNDNALGDGWPLLVLDKYNNSGCQKENGTWINDFFALGYAPDLLGNLQITICPIDANGKMNGQCGGFIWYPDQAQYTFMCCDMQPAWWPTR